MLNLMSYQDGAVVSREVLRKKRHRRFVRFQ